MLDWRPVGTRRPGRQISQRDAARPLRHARKPLTRDGRPQAGADARLSGALRNVARRKQRRTYHELDRSRRCCLVDFGLDVGWRWDAEATFLCLLARAGASSAPAAARAAAQAAWFLWRRNARSRPPFWNSPCSQSWVMLVRLQLCTSSLPTHAGTKLPRPAACCCEPDHC